MTKTERAGYSVPSSTAVGADDPVAAVCRTAFRTSCMSPTTRWLWRYSTCSFS
ncbi:hypothetical protein [Halogeometricum sp. CBA1124]|uniref:hypothetical protein n=1 Tax=Halogeometricum sp. CBA1124 TaxID=2668071 RepID=UPI001E2DA87B|nr:hypothetical protein [Halogeometricum sp. CBA1124]